MKKSKILIPALSIASVGAVVAPMVTSCAKENMIDLLKYESKFTPITGSKSEADAADVYFGAENAVALLTDDILSAVGTEAYLAQLIEGYLPAILEIEADFSMQSALGNVQGLAVEHTKGQTTAKISGSIHLKLVSKIYEKGYKDDENHLIGVYTLETKHTLTKMPYHLWYASTEPLNGHLTTGITIADLRASDDWMLTRVYGGDLVYKNNSEPEEFETQSENWYKSVVPADGTQALTDFQTKLSFIQWYSTYLWKVTKA